MHSAVMNHWKTQSLGTLGTHFVYTLASIIQKYPFKGCEADGNFELESEFPFNPEKDIYSNLKFMSKPSDPFARWYVGRVDGATRPMENIKTYIPVRKKGTETCQTSEWHQEAQTQALHLWVIQDSHARCQTQPKEHTPPLTPSWAPPSASWTLCHELSWMASVSTCIALIQSRRSLR